MAWLRLHVIPSKLMIQVMMLLAAVARPVTARRHGQGSTGSQIGLLVTVSRSLSLNFPLRLGLSCYTLGSESAKLNSEYNLNLSDVPSVCLSSMCFRVQV